MLDETWQKIVAIGIIVALVIAIIALVPILFPKETGIGVEGAVTFIYSDGSQQTFPFQQDSVNLFSVLTSKATGKRIDTVLLKADLIFNVMKFGQPTSTDFQYFARYYTGISGEFVSGSRSEVGDTIFEGALTPIGQRSVATDAWTYFANGVFTWDARINRYYAEVGSGLQLGQLNFGVTTIKAVYDWISGVSPILSPVASAALGTVAVASRTHLQTHPLVDTRIDGVTFFKDMYLVPWAGGWTWGATNWLTFSGGNYLRMKDGDEVSIVFKIDLLYRYKDATGLWTEWKSKANQPQAGRYSSTYILKVAPGYYIDGGINIVSYWPFAIAPLTSLTPHRQPPIINEAWER